MVSQTLLSCKSHPKQIGDCCSISQLGTSERRNPELPWHRGPCNRPKYCTQTQQWPSHKKARLLMISKQVCFFLFPFYFYLFFFLHAAQNDKVVTDDNAASHGGGCGAAARRIHPRAVQSCSGARTKAPAARSHSRTPALKFSSHSQCMSLHDSCLTTDTQNIAPLMQPPHIWALLGFAAHEELFLCV